MIHKMNLSSSKKQKFKFRPINLETSQKLVEDPSNISNNIKENKEINSKVNSNSTTTKKSNLKDFKSARTLFTKNHYFASNSKVKINNHNYPKTNLNSTKNSEVKKRKLANNSPMISFNEPFNKIKLFSEKEIQETLNREETLLKISINNIISMKEEELNANYANYPRIRKETDHSLAKKSYFRSRNNLDNLLSRKQTESKREYETERDAFKNTYNNYSILFNMNQNSIINETMLKRKSNDKIKRAYTNLNKEVKKKLNRMKTEVEKKRNKREIGEGVDGQVEVGEEEEANPQLKKKGIKKHGTFSPYAIKNTEINTSKLSKFSKSPNKLKSSKAKLLNIKGTKNVKIFTKPTFLEKESVYSYSHSNSKSTSKKLNKKLKYNNENDTLEFFKNNKSRLNLKYLNNSNSVFSDFKLDSNTDSQFSDYPLPEFKLKESGVNSSTNKAYNEKSLILNDYNEKLGFEKKPFSNVQPDYKFNTKKLKGDSKKKKHLTEDISSVRFAINYKDLKDYFKVKPKTLGKERKKGEKEMGAGKNEEIRKLSNISNYSNLKTKNHFIFDLDTFRKRQGSLSLHYNQSQQQPKKRSSIRKNDLNSKKVKSSKLHNVKDFISNKLNKEITKSSKPSKSRKSSKPEKTSFTIDLKEVNRGSISSKKNTDFDFFQSSVLSPNAPLDISRIPFKKYSNNPYNFLMKNKESNLNLNYHISNNPNTPNILKEDNYANFSSKLERSGRINSSSNLNLNILSKANSNKNVLNNLNSNFNLNAKNVLASTYVFSSSRNINSKSNNLNISKGNSSTTGIRNNEKKFSTDKNFFNQGLIFKGFNLPILNVSSMKDIKEKKEKGSLLKDSRNKFTSNLIPFFEFRKVRKTKKVYDSLSDEEIESFIVESNLIHETQKYYGLDSDSLIKKSLDFLVFFFIFTSLIYSIFEISVLTISNFSVARMKIFLAINIINDLINLLDFIGGFSFSFNHPSNNKKIFSLFLIGKHYISKSYFIIDLITCIPVSSASIFSLYFNCFYYTNESQLNERTREFLLYRNYTHNNCMVEWLPIFISFFIILLRITKLFKLLLLQMEYNETDIEKANENYINVISSLKSINYFLGLSNISIKLIYYSFLILIGIHILSCFWIWLTVIEFSNWIVNDEMIDKNLIEIYISSFYFIMTSVLTVGYGDINGVNYYEKFFQIILMILAMIIYTFMISNISNIVKANEDENTQYISLIDFLSNAKITYRINEKLFNKTRRFLDNKYSKKNNYYNYLILLKDLPFSVQLEVICIVYEELVLNLNFFKYCRLNLNSFYGGGGYQEDEIFILYPEFLHYVVTSLIPVNYLKNEHLVIQGDKIEEMIIIENGIISLEFEKEAINFKKEILIENEDSDAKDGFCLKLKSFFFFESGKQNE